MSPGHGRENLPFSPLVVLYYTYQTLPDGVGIIGDDDGSRMAHGCFAQEALSRYSPPQPSHP
eukprot:scaffold20597_cov167-Amphora_coffeaeformis.AAC.4